VITTNLSLVRKTVDAFSMQVSIASMKTRDELMNSLVQLMKTELRHDGGAPKAGGAPVYRTGTLSRSIHGERKTNAGFASYSAIVGPGIIYGRILELGFQNGNKYPYVRPAYDKWLRVAPLIVEKYMKVR